MNGKVKAAILIVAVILTSAVISFVSVVAFMGRSDTIFQGVTVKGIHLGGMTGDEARKALTEYTLTLGQKPVNVTFTGKHGTFNLADVGLQINAAKTVASALQVGRRGNFVEQWQERNAIARESIQIPLDFTISKDKLRVVLDEITKEVRIPPRDARIVITPEETVEIVESRAGSGIDIEKAFGDLQEVLKKGEDPVIELGIVELKPKETTDSLRQLNVNGVLAEFTTRFDIKKTNRVYNIKVAAAALDGILLRPGEEFSFNKVVGPRSQEAGYKLAPTILNKEFIDSLGGGVCQVSTTLYNALLMADVDIVQRSNHSLVVSYVPLGQDAAVAYGGKDLKFQNNLSSALVMKARVHGNALTLKLYGDTALHKPVKVVNTIVKEYPFKIVYKDDPTLPKGKKVVDQKGVKGYRVTSYMLVTQPDGTAKKEKLPASHYAAQDQVVLVGTKPVPKKPVSGSNNDNGGNKPANPPPTQPGTGEQPPVQPPPTDPPQDPDPETEPDPETGQDPDPGTNPVETTP